MADAPVPPPLPAAIRITRPYATEEAFLDRELETLTRASITLLGAQSRPQGVVLRFELVLSTGHVLVRGEGRVVGFKPNAFEGLGGLTLRFTRLDSKSKVLVDRAAALREQRRPSTRPPPQDRSPEPAAIPPSPTTLPGLPMAPPARESGVVESVSEPALPPSSRSPSAGTGAATHADPGSTAGTPGRDSLLDRLRLRAKALDASDIERILTARRGS